LGKKGKYRYFTTVIGQQGEYDVKHKTLQDMAKYEKKLSAQHPYFRHVKSGKL